MLPMLTSISVIIPTHNRARLLRRALDSVYKQTRLPNGVIVVDDGSTDGTARCVHECNPKIRYLRQDRKGVSAARNLGIQQSLGKWLAFLDSDDEWLPRKLERQLAGLTDPPQHRIIHTDEIWIRQGRRVNPMHKHRKYGGQVFKHCLRLCIISPSSVMIHRSIFDQIGLFDESLPVCEDYDLWLRITAELPVLYIDEPLTIKYGGHVDQLSRKYWGMDRFRIRALDNIIKSNRLRPDDRHAAIDMLDDKIQIYLNGARKRSKLKEIAEFQAIRSQYLTEDTTNERPLMSILA